MRLATARSSRVSVLPSCGGEGNGDAVAAEVNGGLATGNGSVIGHPADEPRRSTEVVEVEGFLDAVAVALPAW